MKTLVSNVIEYKPILKGMQRAGFVTSTQTAEGAVLYGIFGSQESARAWANELEGETTIMPVYEAAYNRG